MKETPVKVKVTLTQEQASILHYLLKQEPRLCDLHTEVIGGLCDAQARDRERARRAQEAATKVKVYVCSKCGTRGKIVNQCGCDPANLPTVVQYERVSFYSRSLYQEAGMFFDLLREAGLNPTWEMGESAESVISLPINEAAALRELQRREPERFGNAPWEATHLTTPDGRIQCGAPLFGTLMIADINRVTCPRCLEQHETIVEAAEARLPVE